MNIVNTVRKTAFPGKEVIVIPTVSNKKYTVSSRGVLTGCLNLTIDKAPTIPRDSAILPEIVCVITRLINGKRAYVVIFVKLLAQDCPEIIRE